MLIMVHFSQFCELQAKSASHCITFRKAQLGIGIRSVQEVHQKSSECSWESLDVSGMQSWQELCTIYALLV